ncbi:hypothetical protein K504DRAFT_511489 [Pleomassaria siparia CBS 279.74]|uniref:Uncharacterized protein n=1 Tax=Pleomassaria siparia CBS 279.74 TaxID=1314801 RepID=A0A6G1K533_9PLEO|nr:hypothetical protein K504DRAFT_511489 [Pleomassaria siparia CBS 279.74]
MHLHLLYSSIQLRILSIHVQQKNPEPLPHITMPSIFAHALSELTCFIRSSLPILFPDHMSKLPTNVYGNDDATKPRGSLVFAFDIIIYTILLLIVLLLMYPQFPLGVGGPMVNGGEGGNETMDKEQEEEDDMHDDEDEKTKDSMWWARWFGTKRKTKKSSAGGGQNGDREVRRRVSRVSRLEIACGGLPRMIRS